MSLPSGKADIFGNLVVSGSTELNIPVGVNISNGSSATSSEIPLPNPGTNIVLVQMGSGDITAALSVYETSADFVTPTDSQRSLNGQQLFLKGNSTTTLNKCKVRITNNSGTSLAPVQLGLFPLVKYIEGVDLLSGDRGNAHQGMNSTHLTPDGSTGTGAFVLTEGN